VQEQLENNLVKRQDVFKARRCVILQLFLCCPSDLSLLGRNDGFEAGRDVAYGRPSGRPGSWMVPYLTHHSTPHTSHHIREAGTNQLGSYADITAHHITPDYIRWSYVTSHYTHHTTADNQSSRALLSHHISSEHRTGSRVWTVSPHHTTSPLLF
jgi:hypothetical protein